MKIAFNGTAASEGFPALFCKCKYCEEARILKGKNLRRRSSIMIDDRILIDLNADSYAANLYGKLNLSEIDTLLFTHSHTDHCYALDVYNAFEPLATDNDNLPIQIYGNKYVHEKFVAANEWNEDTSAGFIFNEIDIGTTIEINGYRIKALEAKHASNENCLVFIIEKDGKTFFYGTDSSIYCDRTFEELKSYKIDMAVFDCTTIEEGYVYDTHMGIPENLVVKNRLLENNIITDKTPIYLTHLSHKYNPLHENVKKVAKKNGFIAAYDDLVVEI